MSSRFKNEPYIRYANCYEDAETLLKVVGGSKDLLSVASGGDNSLALLTVPTVASLTVFDRNPAQLFITKLKFEAFKYLAYEEVLELLGISKGNPLAVYADLRKNLDDRTRGFFDIRQELIGKVKLINCGKFEYYLNKLRKLVINTTQSKKNIHKFMNMETSGQKDFYIRKINNFGWRTITKSFFSQKAVSKLGRDKSSFAYADGDLYKSITDRMLLCFDNVPNCENIYLQYTVYGKYIRLPYYLRRENFDTIRSNIDKASFVLGDVKEIYARGNKYDFFNLSDIFEYMGTEETKENEKMISSCAKDNAKVVFWNMLVTRHFIGEEFSPLCEKEIKKIYQAEKAYYYQALRIYIKCGGNS